MQSIDGAANSTNAIISFLSSMHMMGNAMLFAQAVNDKIAMSFITLTFSNRSLEKKYRETYRLNSIRTFLTYAPWIAIILTAGFSVFFWAYHFLKPLLYLYGIGIISMGGLYLHFRYFPPSYRLLEIIFAMAAVGFGWFDSALLILLPQFQNYAWGLVAIHVVSSSLALPVRFLSAVASQSLVLLGFVYISIALSNLAITDAFVQVILLNGVAGLCFFAAYWREKLLRENFLHQETINLYSQALKSEMEKGRKIQRDFLPTALPALPYCDIAFYFHPANQLSGDFYDVFQLPGKCVGLVVADVSDKGVGSALFMALLRSLIRIFSGHSKKYFSIERHGRTISNVLEESPALSDTKPAAALNAVFLSNEYIANEHGGEGMFATLFFGIFDPSSGVLTYVNGGHEPLLVLGENGIKNRLKPTGPALGIIPGTNYKIKKVQLHKGDILFGFTDGVTEARSPMDELYTRTRLEKSIENYKFTSSADFLENVKSNLFSFIKQTPQSDDITMLAVRRDNN
ncbi:SpoIIE family protein phosphatase [candidate division KSB1 bacterium]|nr:SpoIIE family protein phosphatase [candidate division KSB1 bacterium]